MRRLPATLLVSLLPALAVAASSDWTMLDKYCNECHNDSDWAGGIAFTALTPKRVGEDAEIWESAVRRMRGRLMPPPGSKQPAQRDIDAFVRTLENQIDTAAAASVRPGYVVLHRLNRTEYGRAIQGLLDLEVDATELLPRDINSDGFDNVASVLSVSPSYLDQYIEAARQISLRATARPSPGATTYKAAGGQSDHVPGLPPGTRGGLSAQHIFPADGEYSIDVRLDTRFATDQAHTLVITLDGKRVFAKHLGGAEDQRALDQGGVQAQIALRKRFEAIPVHAQAGAHELAVTFIARSEAEADVQLAYFVPGTRIAVPGIAQITIAGPKLAPGATLTSNIQTPSRRRIFTCMPAQASEEQACARTILGRLASQAWRRPVDEEDLRAPLRFYANGRTSGGFEAGIQQGLMAVLSSPNFLYRVEATPPDAVPGVPYRVSDVELASRLSFFLWSQGPDEQLLQLAQTNRLHDPQVLDQQVRRMLADQRARTLITNFAFQWLKLDGIESVDPDAQLYPEFDAALRHALRTEMELFLDSVLRSDQSVLALLNADYSFVNERLALHYGIPGVRGAEFRRIALTDPHRRGLLGKGGVLLATSYPDRTSPVLRGVWILESLSGTPPTAPPPNIPALTVNEPGAKTLTVRERLEKHRADASCNACHGVIDPLGFALENYDVIGRWQAKDRYARVAIDSSGMLPGGVRLKGPDDLVRALQARPDQFVQALTEKLLLFALGRSIEYRDMPTVRAVVHQAAQDEYRFAALVLGVVRSDPFQMKSLPRKD